jgi:hypothetical protein
MKDRPRVRQRHDEQRDLDLLAGQPDRRLPEVDLGLAGGMRQRQKDFLTRLLPGPDHVLHDGLPALVTVFIPQPLEDPLRRVPLLLGRLPVLGEDLVNDRQKRFELALRSRLVLPIAGRLLVRQDLLESVPAQSVLPAGGTPAQLAGQNPPTNVSPELHIGSHSGAFLSRGVRSRVAPPSCLFTGLHSCAPPNSTAATLSPRRRFEPPSTVDSLAEEDAARPSWVPPCKCAFTHRAPRRS